MRLDLHVHSSHSRDGIASPEEIVRRLKMTGVYDRGAGTFSITFSGKITVP